MSRYGVYSQELGKWFSGFSPDGSQRWGDENHSKPYERKDIAEGQANLFRRKYESYKGL